MLPAVVPVLVKISAIEAPEPLPNPVIVPLVGVEKIAAVQVNVVPPVLGFNTTLLTEPLQIV